MPTNKADIKTRINVKRSTLVSMPFRSNTPENAINKLIHCFKLTFSLRMEKPKSVENMGPTYRIDMAEPNGMRCTAQKNVDNERKPVIDRNNSSPFLFPIKEIFFTNI